MLQATKTTGNVSFVFCNLLSRIISSTIPIGHSPWGPSSFFVTVKTDRLLMRISFHISWLSYCCTYTLITSTITPSLNDKIDSGKTHLQDLARWWRTSKGVDIPKISQFYWALFEKTRFLCFYIIKSMARKGYFGPKSDFRGSKIPPRGASST